MSSEIRVPHFLTEKRETIAAYAAFCAGGPIPRWPLELSLELSNECDLACVMCEPFSALNPERTSAGKDFLPFDSFREALHEVLCHTLAIHCGGKGEPTRIPDFARILAELAQYEAPIDFSTHGMHLTDELCEQLVESGIARVGVSLSGVRKQDYESVHVGGDFDRVLDGISRLSARKRERQSSFPIIEVRTLAFEHQLASLSRFVRLVARSGANEIRLSPLEVPATVPALAGHGAVFRPSVEGPVLDAAEELARELGVKLIADEFRYRGRDPDGRWAALKNIQYVKVGHPFMAPKQVVPIDRFPRLQSSPRVLESNAWSVKDTPSPEVSGESLRYHLQLRTIEELPPQFYCFEPFSHLMVRSDGALQGCALADRRAPELGGIPARSAAVAWSGERFSMVRRGILNRRYPMAACESCLRFRYAPYKNRIGERVEHFRSWWTTRFSAAEEFAIIGPEADENDAIVSRLFERQPELGYSADELLATASRPDLAGDPRLNILVQEVNRRMASGQSVREVLMGHLDAVVDGEIVGWIWSPLFPDLRLPVEISDNGIVLGRAVAERFRSDLHAAGMGDGICGFAFPEPPAPAPSRERLYQATFPGTEHPFRQGPLRHPISED